MTTTRKWALITGCSPGGLGEATTDSFLTRGVNVIATDISTSATSYTPPDPSTNNGFLVKMNLDVTSPSSILSALEAVHHLTDGNLHFLINNAGYGYYTPLLDVDIEEAKKQYDVNVWGLLAVTQAFFPMLRAARGTVVNQASISGVQGFNMPFMGVYSSSKAAVISLSDTMRVEFEPLGVKVVALITSAVKTEFFRNRVGGFVPATSVYAPVKAAVDVKLGGEFEESNGADRWVVAESTVEELLKENPPSYIRKGSRASFLCWVYWLLPTWLMDSLNVEGLDLHVLNEVALLDSDEVKKD
jgi:NAD(P)-dependent dehydrogenase (short-subunit alcohol dehydrogenase family)